MADLPYMQFFVGDWLRDTRALTASAKGAWADLICYMWMSQEPGTLTLRLSAFGRLIGLPEERTSQVLEELTDLGVCNREDLEDGRIKITCRRVVRDHSRLADEKEAQREAGRRGAEAKRLKALGLEPPPSSPPVRDPVRDPSGPPTTIPESRFQNPEKEGGRRASATPPLPISDLVSRGLAAMWPDATVAMDAGERSLMASAAGVLAELTDDDWHSLAAWTKADNRTRDQKSMWPRDRAEFLRNASEVVLKVRKWWRKNKPKPPAPPAPSNIVSLNPSHAEDAMSTKELKAFFETMKTR